MKTIEILTFNSNNMSFEKNKHKHSSKYSAYFNEKYTLKNDLGEVFFKGGYVAEEGIVYNAWYGPLALEDIQRGGAAQQQMVVDHSCPVILNDNRPIEGSWDHCQEWVANEWNPAVAKAGLKRMALIMSGDKFAQFCAEEFVEMQEHYHLGIFDPHKEELAVEWLFERHTEAAKQSTLPTASVSC